MYFIGEYKDGTYVFLQVTFFSYDQAKEYFNKHCNPEYFVIFKPIM